MVACTASSSVQCRSPLANFSARFVASEIPVNRDSVLYLFIGLLSGFIAGFMMHEAMASRQPAPNFIGMAEQVGPGARPQMPQAGGPSVGGGPEVGGAGNPQEAMQQVQRLRQHVEENPQDLESLKLLANLNGSIRNLTRAGELYGRYLEQKPDDLEVLQAYGNLSFDQQDWPKAAELYEAFLELSPNRHEVRTDLGAVYRYQGRFQDALGQFEIVRGQNPSHWQALYNEVLVRALDLKDYSGAEKTLEALRTLRPGDAEIERLAAEVERLRQGA